MHGYNIEGVLCDNDMFGISGNVNRKEGNQEGNQTGCIFYEKIDVSRVDER